MRILLHAVFSLLLLASCANDLVEEQVDVEGDGAVSDRPAPVINCIRR